MDNQAFSEKFIEKGGYVGCQNNGDNLNITVTNSLILNKLSTITQNITEVVNTITKFNYLNTSSNKTNNYDGINYSAR